MRGDIPALVALSKRGSKAGGLAGGGTSAALWNRPSRPLRGASGRGRMLRRQVPQSGPEESVQCGKRFLSILLREKMTGLNRFELHVYAFVPPCRLNVEERRRRG
jgi:hypothetical protein